MAHPVRCMTAVLLPMTFALHGCSSKGDDTGSGGDPPISEAEAEGANPGECTDGADNDGDGDFDCSDADCVGSPDCSEANTPGGCADGVDNDGDGLSDCDDPDCAGDDACITGPEGDAPGECADGVDNDEDGLTDCDDPDCADAPDCESAAVGSLDNPGQSCMDILSRGGSTGDGPYWIDADGPQGVAPVDVLCDMTTDGGGWTLMVADASMGTTEKDACEFWSVRPSGASASVTTCASQQLTAACSQNICEFDLQLDAPHEFTEVRFAGTAFSSGGTQCPVWSGPLSDAPTPDYGDATYQRCSDQTGGGRDCAENGPVSETVQLDAGAVRTAAWYMWSDEFDTCGGSGGEWDLTSVMVR